MIPSWALSVILDFGVSSIKHLSGNSPLTRMGKEEVTGFPAFRPSDEWTDELQIFSVCGRFSLNFRKHFRLLPAMHKS